MSAGVQTVADNNKSVKFFNILRTTFKLKIIFPLTDVFSFLNQKQLFSNSFTRFKQEKWDCILFQKVTRLNPAFLLINDSVRSIVLQILRKNLEQLTCQVSRFRHDTHRFELHLTVSKFSR